MENNRLGDRSWTEYFRIITPFLLIVITFVGATINKNLDTLDTHITAIDNKLFLHLTNDEIHAIRSNFISKSEFDIVSIMREKQFSKIEQAIYDLKDEVKQLRKDLKK